MAAYPVSIGPLYTGSIASARNRQNKTILLMLQALRALLPWTSSLLFPSQESVEHMSVILQILFSPPHLSSAA